MLTTTEMIDALNQNMKKRKQSAAYKIAMACLTLPNYWFSCGENTGSGKYSSSKSYSYDTKTELNKVGATVELRNIAPRGGKAGDQIRIIL